MALDASSILGSPQLAGVKVNPQGSARKQGVATALGGGVGAAIGMAAQRQAEQNRPEPGAPTETPKFGRLAFLAVTDAEIAIVQLKSGVVRVHLGEVVVRVPREQVMSVELVSGLAPPLNVTFADGGTWELEVPRPSKKSAEEVVALFA